jgi:hypothetical protein
MADFKSQPGAFVKDTQQHVIQKINPLASLINIHGRNSF